MPVSGSKNYSITAATIIEGAHRKLGTWDAADPVGGDEVTTSLIALNLMVKEWVVDGVELFLRSESTLFLQPNTQSYALSSAEITDTITAETTVLTAEASGQADIAVTSTSGMSISDRAGIKLDDNTIHWSTISAIGTNQITLAVSTDGAAAAGNKVYTYTTKSDRPQKIIYAFRKDINDFDTEIEIIGENDYQRQSNKTSDGPPVECWYNPRGNQATGLLRVWPDNGGKNWDKLVLICQHLPDDFDATGDSPDFPIEWGNALIWGLAAEIMTEFGDLTDRQMNRIERIAFQKLDKQLDYSVENASVKFAIGR